MQIINILEIINGVPKQIESFPIWEEQLSQDVVDEAEKVLIEMVKYHKPDISDNDVEWVLEEGFFNDNNGHEIYIIWSN